VRFAAKGAAVAKEAEPAVVGAVGGSGTPSPSYEPIYAIFQGGGAKGITHIGALKAIEEERLVPVGIAGTSAGAIVAALVAVGYKADELLDPVQRTSILGEKSPVDWLGRNRWWMFRALRRLAPPLLLAAAALLALLLTASIVSLFFDVPRFFINGALALLLVSLGVLAALLASPIRRRGLFTSTALRDLVNEKLREKLAKHYETIGKEGEPPLLVTFADIDPVAVPLCSALKIVVSDIRKRKLVLFDASTPGVVVADAVAASSAIPFAISPPTVRGWTGNGTELFADGGLLSNLPSWVFTVEKRALERKQQSSPIPIMAFTLVPETQALEKAADGDAAVRSGSAKKVVPRTSLSGYVADVMGTGIFGSQTLVEQFVTDLEVIELPTALSTLGFDCGWGAAVRAREAGYRRTKDDLRRRRQKRMLTNRLLALVLEDVTQRIAARRESNNQPMPRLRLCLVDPSGPRDRPASEFRVVASANMQEDADDRLPLDPRNGAAPQAFRDRKAIFAIVRHTAPLDLWMTKYEHALVRPDVCSIIAIPVFGRPPRPGSALPQPQRVLCLDSSDDLRDEFNDPIFMTTLTRSSFATSSTLIRERVRLKEQSDG
jgi:NTE family protein